MRFLRKTAPPEFLTYLVIGGLTAVAYFGILALSVEILALDYRLSVSVAYIFAVSFHFLANRRFTFHRKDGQFIREGFRYSGVLLINYLITIGVVSFLVGKLGLSTYLSAVLSIVVTVGVGYFASKFWVFRNGECLRD